MRNVLIVITVAIFTVCNAAGNPIKEYKLKNGLTVWLDVDKSQPKAFGAVVVNAGAIDTPDTGIAHYFEHIMFKGTDKMGTTDYSSEKVYIDSITMKYSQLAKTTDKVERENIQKEINRLSIKAADYAIPNEFTKLITRYGGSNVNAYTSYEKTVYYNSFSPQYIEQWLELNSERIMNPVFRLFQSELETVYEEKNMYQNSPFAGAMSRAIKTYFDPSPYAYEVIGSTENLKNPNLEQMTAFFKKYYVGSNMGLILSGNFDEEKVIPMIEKAFSRIESGEPNNAEYPKARKFSGKEVEELKISIPVIKGFAYAWRAVPAMHEDQQALKLMTSILNNSNSTGFLDKLSIDGKLLASFALNEGMKGEGILAVIGIPKLMFQSYGAAEKLLNEQIDRIKDGDFDEEIVEAIKLENRSQRLRNLENIDMRSRMLIEAFSNGVTWEEYLAHLESADKLTKKDIVEVANKYLTNDMLYAKKKNGKYPQDNLKKPPFDPIVPPNKDSKSVYAKELEEIPVKYLAPKFVDFEKDAKIITLTPKATLYIKENQKNDIFILKISFGKGTREHPILKEVAQYISLIGTNEKSYEDFKNKFQKLGASIDFTAYDNKFNVVITGFDKNFDYLLDAATDFMRNLKADDKKIKQIIDGIKTEDKAFKTDINTVSDALSEYVKFGDKSIYLTRATASKIKSLKGDDLVSIFKDVIKVQADFHYSGTLPTEKIESVIREKIDLNSIGTASKSPVYREMKIYDKPQVFFVNQKDATQTIIKGYTPTGDIINNTDRAAAMLFGLYFGGGMESVLFQEIREFRSFAYSTYANIRVAPKVSGSKPGMMSTHLSTQNDKAIEALSILDSLQRSVAIDQQKLDATKGVYLNYVTNEYPNFRDITTYISESKQSGWNSNQYKMILQIMDNMTPEDVNKFVAEKVRSRQPVYIVVGDKKKIDMKGLAKFGEIKEINIKEIYNQ